VLSFFSQAVYGVTTDGSLKTALKASSEPKELLASSPFKEMLEEILALIAPPPHGGPAAMEIVACTDTDSVAVDGLTLATLAVPAEVMKKHEGSLTTWLTTLHEHQSTFVRLISQGDGGVGQIAALLEGSVVKHLDSDQRLLIFYDSKCAGEASTQAHVRLPSFNQERFKTMMQAVFTARKDPENHGPCGSDIVMIMDGGRQIDSKITSNLVKADGHPWPSRHRQLFTVCYDEKTYEMRRERSRGFVQLTEGVHCYSSEPMVLEKRQRLHFWGSNMAEIINPVPLPDWKELWLLDRPTKLKLYTANGRHLSSGPNPDPDFVPPKFDNAREPVAWHSNHVKLYEELLVSFQCKAVVDLTACDEQFALACVHMKVPYLGVCWGDRHKELLDKQLGQRMWSEYRTEGSALFRAD
ncbi:unnamed protein product, partial [Symbiodinium necroappetens]